MLGKTAEYPLELCLEQNLLLRNTRLAMCNADKGVEEGRILGKGYAVRNVNFRSLSLKKLDVLRLFFV